MGATHGKPEKSKSSVGRSQSHPTMRSLRGPFKDDVVADRRLFGVASAAWRSGPHHCQDFQRSGPFDHSCSSGYRLASWHKTGSLNSEPQSRTSFQRCAEQELLHIALGPELANCSQSLRRMHENGAPRGLRMIGSTMSSTISFASPGIASGAPSSCPTGDCDMLSAQKCLKAYPLLLILSLSYQTS